MENAPNQNEQETPPAQERAVPPRPVHEPERADVPPRLSSERERERELDRVREGLRSRTEREPSRERQPESEPSRPRERSVQEHAQTRGLRAEKSPDIAAQQENLPFWKRVLRTGGSVLGGSVLGGAVATFGKLMYDAVPLILKNVGPLLFVPTLRAALLTGSNYVDAFASSLFGPLGIVGGAVAGYLLSRYLWPKKRKA